MDVTRLAGLGRGFGARLRQYFEAPLDGDASPLEIAQAALDDAAVGDRRGQAGHLHRRGQHFTLSVAGMRE